MFEADAQTDQIVMIGEMRNEEEAAAEYISRYVTKPVVAFIAVWPLHPVREWGTLVPLLKVKRVLQGKDQKHLKHRGFGSPNIQNKFHRYSLKYKEVQVIACHLLSFQLFLVAVNTLLESVTVLILRASSSLILISNFHRTIDQEKLIHWICFQVFNKTSVFFDLFFINL